MKYTDSQEWVDLQEDIATVGISKLALEALGEIVHIEFPNVGDKLHAHDEACVIESSKSATDVYSPISGCVIAINEELKSNVSIINQDPEKKGWLFKMQVFNLQEYNDLPSE